MMKSSESSSQLAGRIFVYRFPGPRAGWLTRVLVLAALLAAIPLVLLLVVGLWALLAVVATVIAVTAVLSVPILRRLRGTPPSQGRVVEGEARRLDVDS